MRLGNGFSTVSTVLAVLALSSTVAAQAKPPAAPSSAAATSAPSPSKASATSQATSAAAPTVGDASIALPGATTVPGVPGSIFHLTGLPTIAGAGVPTVIVPVLNKAPFMQKSSLPEGTVFIAVGALLGVLGALVLAWHGLVAWSLHRSVKRAASSAHPTDSKNALRPPKAFYSAVGASSNLSLDHLSGSHPGRGRHASNPSMGAAPGGKGVPSKTASALFFSPTAGSGQPGGVNRSSTYLPAGYYAAGASNTASGAPMTTVGNGAPSPLLPPSFRPPRTSQVNPSPPGTPNNGFARNSGYDRQSGTFGSESPFARNSAAPDVGQYGNSSSTLNLAVPPQGRAPSAYLEDLFEHHGHGQHQGGQRDRF